MKAATLVLACFTPFAATAQNLNISWLDEPGRLLIAGQQTVLRVRVTDGENPAPATKVEFAVQRTGPAGVFVPADGSAKTPVLTVETDADGVASAALEAGAQAGPYLVEARLPGAPYGVTFGIANVPPRTQAPALSAPAVRRTLEAKLPAGGVVHGPVWIPALTTVTSGGPPSIYAPSSSFTTSVTGSWFFWIDPRPGQLFGHGVQYVITDASRTDAAIPNARFSRELWWPSVRVSGSAAVMLLPPSAAAASGGEGACALVVAGPGSRAAENNALRMRDFWSGALEIEEIPLARSRDDVAHAVQQAADQNCSSFYLHVTAHGFPPRLPRGESGGGFGGVVLANANAQPGDFVDYSELAAALLPLKGKARLTAIIEAPYSANAPGAFSGIGLAGELLAGSGDFAGSAEGTPLGGEVVRLWQEALDEGREFDLGRLQASSEFQTRFAQIVPDGPKALPLPNFSLSGTGVIERAAIRLPDDLPAGTVNARVTTADEHIAEVDPSTATVSAGSQPEISVLGAGPGVTTYTVRLVSGDAAPYEGTGTIAVGQEVACTPSRIAVTAGWSSEFRIGPGSVYDPLFNGSTFNLRLFNEGLAGLSTSRVTFGDSLETVRVTGWSPGTTTLEVSGTRTWGQPFTACVVEVTVVPEFGEGTMQQTLYVGQTDASMRRITTQYRAVSDSVTDVALSGNLLCAAGAAPLYAGLPVTSQAPQKALSGKVDAQVACFRPPEANRPASFRFSTLLGGKEPDVPVAVVPDSQGNVFVVGITASTDFPITPGGRRPLGKGEIFIAKISRFGDRVLFASYFGGTGDDVASGAAVDAAGNLYVTGYTNSFDLPVTQPGVQSGHGGGLDAFITKFNGATGALVFSMYYGGFGDERAHAIAVDPQGSAYIAGWTASHNLPGTEGGFQPREADGPACPQAGNVRPCPDGFVARFRPDGTGLQYATFLGGTSLDYVTGLTLDASGNAVLTGVTYSTDFPVTAGVLQSSKPRGLCGGGLFPCADIFVSILNPSGTQLMASTYLGGDGSEETSDIAIDAAGNVYLIGTTNSPNLPVTAGALQTGLRRGDNDAFLAALSPGLKNLLGLTYFGSNGTDQPGGLAVSPGGRVYFGLTASEKDLPVQ